MAPCKDDENRNDGPDYSGGCKIMRFLTKTVCLVALGAAVGGVSAQGSPFVSDDQPGAELRFEKPAFAPEGLCKSNMASDKGCAFKTTLVEVDGQKITPSTRRKSYRMPTGKHTIVAQHGPVGKKSTKRGYVGVSQHTVAEYGHPGRIELDLKDGEVWQIYSRCIPITDDNPFGWELVAKQVR